MPTRDKRFGPRPETEEAVMVAAFEILTTEGSRALTPLRLHQVTGVARTTIYRHWPQPGPMIEQLVRFATAPHHLEHMTGDARGDLTVTVDLLATRIDTRPMRQLYAALVEYGTSDDAPAITADQYMSQLSAPTHELIDRALEHGLLAGADAAALTSELLGPIFHRHLLLAEPVPAGLATSAVARFWSRHSTDG